MTGTKGWSNLIYVDICLTWMPQAPMDRANGKHDALHPPQGGSISFLTHGCTKKRMIHATALHSVAIRDQVDSSLHNVEWIETSRKGNGWQNNFDEVNRAFSKAKSENPPRIYTIVCLIALGSATNINLRNPTEVPALVGLGFNPHACALPTSGLENGDILHQGDQALYYYIDSETTPICFSWKHMMQ